MDILFCSFYNFNVAFSCGNYQGIAKCGLPGMEGLKRNTLYSNF
jgi:hypothetical protein